LFFDERTRLLGGSYNSHVKYENVKNLPYHTCVERCVFTPGDPLHVHNGLSKPKGEPIAQRESAEGIVGGTPKPKGGETDMP